MNYKVIAVSLAALLVGGIGSYYLFARSHHHSDMHDETDRHTGHQMHDAADPHDGHDMHMMVESEQEFIIGMIPHHQEAIDTAREVLARGGTLPEIAALAEGIIIAQESEIALMEAWYLEWYGTPYQSNDTYQPMMRALSALSGTELDRTFLEDMIPHHMGAIMMAQSVQPHITHQEITDLTAEIIASQSAEIEEMRRLLDLLPEQD